MNDSWRGWDGKVVQSTYSKSYYIQTTQKMWKHRLNIWSEAWRKDENTKCPCPMPVGHCMFKDKVHHKPINF